MSNMSSFWRVGIVFLTFAAHVLVWITAREDFYLLLGVFTGVFWLYLLIIEEYELKDVFYMAIALRLFWVFATPNLSDDYHRFIWDGTQVAEGINPYEFLPGELAGKDFAQLEENSQLLINMNSPQYYSVYPPVNQLYFTLASVFSSTNHGKLLALKFLFFLTEFLGLLVLFKLAKSGEILKNKFSLWALNPLVIIEGIGNLHFEVVMLVFVLLAVVYFKKKWWLSAIFCGLAISTKLLPLMFLPLLIPYYGWGKSIKYGGLAVLTFLLTLLPFLSIEIIQNVWSSLDLYFQTFEFNASIFYIVKWIGEMTIGWDIVQTAGPIMAGITILVIAVLSLLPKGKTKLSLPAVMLVVSTTYLLMSTTVHPWYVIIPFGISLFSKHKFPVWWTFLVFMSYSFYINGTIEEKPLFVIIEYVALAVMIILEIRRKRSEKVSLGFEEEHPSSAMKA